MMTHSLLSIVLFGEGLLTGLTLTAMLGPVTMCILRYGIQVDRVAGVLAAAGTWVSDFVFIAATYWMTEALSELTEEPSVRFWIFLVGGIGLTIMGLLMMRVKRRKMINEVVVSPTGSYLAAFGGGFLVNSLSPFTLFFWIGAAVLLHMQSDNPLWYYSGLMLSLAMGDFFKAWMAPKLTKWIQEKYVYWVQVIAGIVITIAGLYIIGMGFYEKVS